METQSTYIKDFFARLLKICNLVMKRNNGIFYKNAISIINNDLHKFQSHMEFSIVSTAIGGISVSI